MYLDGQLTFSNLQNGDSPTAVADNASASYIDRQVAGLNFSPPGGSAYVAPWVVARVQTLFTSNGAATLQAVLQDAADTSTTGAPGGPGAWTDRILGPVTALASLTAGAVLLAQRLPATLARYIRIVWRIGTAVMTAGVAQAFIAMDIDVTDLQLRETGTLVNQTGQISEAVGNGVLAS